MPTAAPMPSFCWWQGSGYTVHVNASGGRAYFLEKPSATAMKAALDDALDVFDVQWETDLQVTGGNVSYIHKGVDGTDVFFFANSSETAVDTHVRFRGKHTLELWDPHTGEIRRAEHTQVTVNGQDMTRVRLVLLPVTSMFLVGRPD